jgi:hypothetical protein
VRASLSGLLCLFAACSSGTVEIRDAELPRDAASSDSGSRDLGFASDVISEEDAGASDAIASSDSGAGDAGFADASAPDAMDRDATTPDAASCACGSGADGVIRPTSSTTIAARRYEVESFEIGAGITLTVTGTVPLEIRSLGPVRIAGALFLDGDDGQGACAPEINVGGEGRAGGATGGDTGRDGAGPGAGFAGASGRQFSGGVRVENGMAGGGGGAGHARSGEGGQRGDCCASNCSPAALGGASGGSYGAIDRVLGGSGGGSGGTVDRFTGSSISGAGGGGGGGAVRIVAPSIVITGEIGARGGAGGMGCSTSGGGGGGSGGTIWLEADRVAITGTVAANGGSGGVASPMCAPADLGTGGRGSEGRVRIDAIAFAGTSTPAAVTGMPACTCL